MVFAGFGAFAAVRASCRSGLAGRFLGSNWRATMGEHKVVLRLNQQQLELLDRTIEKGEAADRVDLVHRALREYAADHGKKSKEGLK